MNGPNARLLEGGMNGTAAAAATTAALSPSSGGARSPRQRAAAIQASGSNEYSVASSVSSDAAGGTAPPPQVTGRNATTSPSRRQYPYQQQQQQQPNHQQAFSASSPGVVYEPMEVEVLHPRPSHRQQMRLENRNHSIRASHSVHPLDQVWHMVKLFMELNPIKTTVIFFILIGFVFHAVFDKYLKPGITRNKLGHYDYASTIDLDFNFKLSQLDHWCLFGDDDTCTCEDFIDPVPRSEIEQRGWRSAQLANLERIQTPKNYDVVFLGDEMIEIWNGRKNNQIAGGGSATSTTTTTTSSTSSTGGENANRRTPINGMEINAYWNRTFTKEGGGQFEGLALGIAGDSTSNLLWRITKGGEIPEWLSTQVFWVLIGTNDLARGGCSEEVVTLGILKAAEEIHHRHPDAVIVLQGILPRSHDANGRLEGGSSTINLASLTHNAGLVHSSTERLPDAESAYAHALLWPSIQRINAEIAKFCDIHEHLVYFDASKLFIGNLGNEYYHDDAQLIIRTLMPDFVHPSATGMEIMGNAIARELDRIINHGDESNDIEEKQNNNNR